MPGLEPLFLDHGMDMGFWGHEHSYERFYPIDSRRFFNTSTDSDNAYINAVAPTYVISGAAGCHSSHQGFDKTVPHSAYKSTDFGYTLLEVKSKNELYLEQISIESKSEVVIDKWTMKKDSHLTGPSRARAKRHVGVDFPPFKERDECNIKDPICKHKRRQHYERYRLKKRAS